MSDACSDGLHWFDFLLSGSLSGVARFKEGFGSSPVAYNGYWSPGMTSDRTRPDTGTGAAAGVARELRQRQAAAGR
jgi:hypothetical protein